MQSLPQPLELLALGLRGCLLFRQRPSQAFELHFKIITLGIFLEYTQADNFFLLRLLALLAIELFFAQPLQDTVAPDVCMSTSLAVDLRAPNFSSSIVLPQLELGVSTPLVMKFMPSCLRN